MSHHQRFPLAGLCCFLRMQPSAVRSQPEVKEALPPERLQRLEKRVEELEKAVKALQEQLKGPAPASLADQLLGSWERAGAPKEGLLALYFEKDGFCAATWNQPQQLRGSGNYKLGRSTASSEEPDSGR